MSVPTVTITIYFDQNFYHAGLARSYETRHSNFRFNNFFFEKRVKTFICRCVFDLVVCGLFKSCFVVYRWPRIRRSQLVESQTKNWRLGLKIVEVKISDKK